ncbi:MAG TPA: hypothetical protein VNA13_03915 [Xanthomonadales bacterium]|nr:hypothetical protein [Xanthomonadales bacterium]
MRKLLLASSLLAITPLAMIIGLVLALNTYSQKSSLTSYRETVAYAALPSNQNIIAGNIIESQNGKAEKIRQFLARYNSPLEPYSVDIVNAAEEYGLDHRLIPAIAMQESTLCKKIPVNSFNCWGFGIYGNKVTRFADYKEGIYTVTKALATRYKSRGLVTADQIMTMYTPSSNGSWARGVNIVLNQLQ